jgi:ribosomal protein L37AE/L43A
MKEQVQEYFEKVEKFETEYTSVFTEAEDVPAPQTQFICPNCFANNAEEIAGGIMHCNNCGWEDRVAVFTATTAEVKNREANTYKP